MDRKQETSAVKRALVQAGFDKNNIRVKHGNGTAWGWLSVSADIHRAPSCYCGSPDEYGRRETCQECKNKWREIYNRMEEVAALASDRDKLRDNHIIIHLGFFAN